MITPNDTTSTDHDVVVGYDASLDARRALEWAASYATSTGARLTVVAAWDWPVVLGAPVSLTAYNPQHELPASIHRTLSDLGIDTGDVRIVVDRGSAAAILTAASRNADLLVVGRRGAGGFEHLMLGSVSMQCLSHAACPVCIVPLVDAA